MPEGWKVGVAPPDVMPRHMVDQMVMWNWPSWGWCVGKVTTRYNGKFRDEANYTVWYDDTETKGFHMFELDSHVLEAAAPTAKPGSWLTLEPIE